MALPVCPRYRSGLDDATEESIDEAAKLKQVLRDAQQGGTREGNGAGLEVGPLGGNQGLASIRQNQEELQVALAVRALQYLQSVALKCVARADDSHPLRKVLTVGSVWRCPSTTWTTNGR